MGELERVSSLFNNIYTPNTLRDKIRTNAIALQRIGEAIKDQAHNHTVIGRMMQGDSLGEAVKNDFMQDTIVGQMLQGKSYFDACKDAQDGGLLSLFMINPPSIFTSENEE